METGCSEERQIYRAFLFSLSYPAVAGSIRTALSYPVAGNETPFPLLLAPAAYAVDIPRLGIPQLQLGVESASARP